MIKVSSIYMDFLHQIQKEEIGVDDFNRLSKLAELRLMYWVTGDIRGGVPPEPYLTQKNKDYVSPFITKYKTTPNEDGEIIRPTDYYQYENMYAMYLSGNEGDGEEDAGGCSENGSTNEESTTSDGIEKVPIELMEGQEFYYRNKTYIQGLRPSTKKPIAKQVGKGWEILPQGIPGVTLEYIRYPKYAILKVTSDPIYYNVIPDEVNSINYEWEENARDVLLFFMVDYYFNSTREQAGKQANLSTAKTPNG